MRSIWPIIVARKIPRRPVHNHALLQRPHSSALGSKPPDVQKQAASDQYSRIATGPRGFEWSLALAWSGRLWSTQGPGRVGCASKKKKKSKRSMFNDTSEVRL